MCKATGELVAMPPYTTLCCRKGKCPGLPLAGAGLCGPHTHVGPCLTEAGMGCNMAGVGTLMWDQVLTGQLRPNMG